jgi:predicted CXXCH cytochrome family protein
MKTYIISFLGFITLFVFFSSWRSIEDKNKYIEEINCADCHSDLTELKYKHEPAIDACDNCHTPNENSHPDSKGREFKLAEAMPSLCFICHEEPTKKRIHAPVEEGECTMCHSPHSSNNRKLLVKEELSSLCFECHDLEIGEKDRVHAPVEMGACEECHDPHQSDNRSLLKSQKPQLCFTCHDNIQTEIEAKYPHAAAVDDCSNCHNSHKSKNRNLLTEKIPDLCFSCHEPFDQKHSHSPVQEGECLSCHAVHGSDNRKLLTEKVPADLCLMCHDLGMENQIVKHVPVEEGECLECHNPHDSENRGLLKQKKTSLCMSCHSDLEENLIMINSHPPFEDDCGNCHDPHKSNEPKLLIEKSNDLCFMCHDDIQEKINHQSIVHAVTKENGACIKCHSPHASNETAMLKKKEKDLCLNCHNKEYSSEFGIIKNIKEQIEKSKHVHPPVKEGCSSCHDPHAGEFPFLLTDYTAPMMYAPANTRNFQLCFNCHDKELMTYKSGNLATNFRNGNQNLHYVHLKGEKARNCNICHAAHAADGEHLIREKTWFGQWEMPIGYEPNLKGGSCLTGCHEKREYFR